MFHRILCSFALFVLVCFTNLSHAAFTVQTLNQFTGDPSQVKVTLFDDAEPGVAAGNIKVKAEVISAITGNTGDLRGIWLDISDDTLLSGLSVVDQSPAAVVTQAVFGPAGTVNNLGGGNNLNGGGTPAPFDMGFEIGAPGIGMGDDFQMAMFSLHHNLFNLSLGMFVNQDVGARVTSVGPVGSGRNGSSKLGGNIPPPGGGDVPEPASLALWGIGLGVAVLSMRRRK